MTASSRSHYGAVLAAGAEIPLGTARLAPELRYTRWAASAGQMNSSLQSNQNQLEVLLGVMWKVKVRRPPKLDRHSGTLKLPRERADKKTEGLWQNRYQSG